MIPNDALINALRSLNFTFKRQADRVTLWRQRGGVKRVAVRRNVAHSEDYAKSILRSAGMSEADIESFVRETRRQ